MTEQVQLKRKIVEGAQTGPHLLITGGVHGDEFEPMAAVRRLIKEVDAVDLRGRLTLVPVVNEAAYQRQHRWAEDGLDLARNCPGRPDGSITQRTAHALAQLIDAADYFIDLHTGGTTMCVLPMSGYTLHDDPKILDTQRAMARAFNLPIIWGTYGKLNGRSLSVAREANVPAIYTEYRGSATCDPDGVEAYVDGCLNVMACLKMIDRDQPDTRIEYVVEDERENAGYMQIQNPSPIEGFFEPAVMLGQRVEPGDLIGTVCDVLGDRVETVRAMQAGIILSIKTFSHLNQDDGLAVVLDVDRPLGGGEHQNL